jgi:hypothetical protein
MSAKDTEQTVTATESDTTSANSRRTGTQSETAEKTLDLVFGILKNSRRRLVLEYLQDTDQEVTLSDLAEHIAAIENDTTPERLTSSERKRVYVGLYQCHLPKMDDAGAIDYNQQRGLIRRTEQTERFESYLKQGSDEPSRRWYRYYGAIAALGVIPMLVSGSVSATVLTGLYAVILLAVGFCAVSHWWLQSSSDDDDGVQMPG